jgi:hypothetical protein
MTDGVHGGSLLPFRSAGSGGVLRVALIGSALSIRSHSSSLRAQDATGGKHHGQFQNGSD